MSLCELALCELALCELVLCELALCFSGGGKSLRPGPVGDSVSVLSLAMPVLDAYVTRLRAIELCCP